MHPREFMQAMMSGTLRESKPGPVVWCHTCHRYHERRKHPATFRQVERETPAGNKRMHWAHCAVPEKPKRKTRARKT